METTAARLKKALEMRNMRQIDLSKKTGISKASISQYLSGDVTPKQDKIHLMAKALAVPEIWLAGWDDDAPVYNPLDYLEPNKDMMDYYMNDQGLSYENAPQKEWRRQAKHDFDALIEPSSTNNPVVKDILELLNGMDADGLTVAKNVLLAIKKQP